MSTNGLRASKEAYLKMTTGQPLTVDERASVAAFLETPEGDAYVEGTEAMKELLGGLKTNAPVPDRAAMVARFEEQLRDEASKVLERRRFVGLCVGVLVFALAGALFMLFVPHPRHGMSERIQGAVIMIVVMSLFPLAIWWRSRRRLKQKNLFVDEWKREVSRRSPVRWVVFALLCASLGFTNGWPLALGLGVGLTVCALVTKRLLRSSRMKQDAELWGWWEETLR